MAISPFRKLLLALLTCLALAAPTFAQDAPERRQRHGTLKALLGPGQLRTNECRTHDESRNQEAAMHHGPQLSVEFRAKGFAGKSS